MRVSLGSSSPLVATLDRAGRTVALAVPPTATIEAASGATHTGGECAGWPDIPNAWHFELDATHTADLDTLVVRFAGTADSVDVAKYIGVEVVSSTMFTIGDLRSMPDLDNEQRYSHLTLTAALDWIEALIETTVETSFCERRYQETRAIKGCTVAPFKAYPSQLFGLTFNGEAVDPAAWELDRSGVLTAPSPFFGSLTIDYSAGFSTHAPADLADAALQAARAKVLSRGQSGMPDRTRSISNEFGSTSFAIAGPNQPTGYPEVDAILMKWRDLVRLPGLA